MTWLTTSPNPNLSIGSDSSPAGLNVGSFTCGRSCLQPEAHLILPRLTQGRLSLLVAW